MPTQSDTLRRVAAAVAVPAVCAMLTGAPLAAEQSNKSSAAAKDLAQAMDAAQLDAIAAQDPSDPGTFVAALYFPGSQILVVSAKYSAPPLLLDKINVHLGAARERRKKLAQDLDTVEDVLRLGAQRARAEAQQTMALVREAVGFAPRSVA